MRASQIVTTGMLVLIGMVAGLRATDSNESPEQRDARMEHWRDARFGMFIHWGPVSLKGTEIGWSRGKLVPEEEYDRLFLQFNPTNFNARQWAKIAKAAGMKYMVFTTKHHDGFCMWDTKQTDFDIMGSPFGRDVVKELAEACKREKIGFGTYYSVCDWHHPDFPLTSPGGRTRRETSNLDGYEQYLRAQVSELIRNYGPLWVMWFDVPQEFDAKRGQGVIDLCRSLQPGIIVNNRSGAPGDYDTPEQHVGVYQDNRPWETCMTIAKQWAWKPNDETKSLKECLHKLVMCAGGDGNLLFNVGPMPDGRIEPLQVERLKEMGKWLKKYGDTIYETRGGPWKPGLYGVSTRSSKTVYLHVLDWQQGPLTLPPLPARIVKSRVLTGGKAVVHQTPLGVQVEVAPRHRHEIDTIIALTLERDAMAIPVIKTYTGSLTDNATAKASNVYANSSEFGADKVVDDNDSSRWATDSGVKQASVELDLGKPMRFMRVAITEAIPDRVKKFELQYRQGDEWKTFYQGAELGQHWTREFPAMTAQHFRLNILEATGGPTIAEIRLFDK